MIALFDLSGVPYGGFVSYTAHLWHALKAMHQEPVLLKIGKRDESKSRPYQDGVPYFNVSLSTAVGFARGGKALVTCCNWGKQKTETEALVRAGARVVLHDPNDGKPELRDLIASRDMCPIAIRRGMAASWGADFAPHPFVRRHPARNQKEHAVSLSRLDWDKHIETIVEANALLGRGERVSLYGAENRMYAHHALDAKYPDWARQYRGVFPRGAGAAGEIAARARYVVDMSLIKGDGGGTQYTFLEAWDAGATLVIQRDWVREGDELRPGDNCLVASGAQELADVLRSGTTLPTPEETLREHEPERVVPIYMELL